MEDCKIAFIYGKDDEKRKTYEGQIEKYGKIEEDLLHSTCLLQYAKERCSHIEIFTRLNYRHRPETIGYFFTAILDDIVFLNTTKNIEKYGKTGVFLMPEEPTEIQKEAVYQFAQEINDFSVNVLYDLSLQDGILEGKEMLDKDPIQMLDAYFSKKEETLSNNHNKSM